MSSMLNQAIVDAQALREAAIKNAETSVIEKYSDQIREAVETILEQPFEEPLEGEEEEGPAEIGSDQDLLDQAPLAATDGENLCPCPEEEEEVVLNLDLDALEDQVAAIDADEEAGMPTQDDLAMDMGAEPPEEEEEEPLFEALSQLDITEAILEEIASNGTPEQTVEVNEEALGELIESLKVLDEPQKSGWQGTPDAMHKDAAEVHAAKDAACASEEEEEAKELRKALDKMDESQKSLKKTLKKKEKDIETLKSVVDTLKDKINESNTLNAKLVYTNKILTNDSLNERQKDKIVEALSKSNSVEETKTIFETLQSAVGTSSKKPYESLSEAVNRNSSTMLSSAKNRKPAKEDYKISPRWKALAGIE